METSLMHPEIEKEWGEICAEMKRLVDSREDLIPEMKASLFKQATHAPCTPSLLAFVINETLSLERSKVRALSVVILMIARGTALAADQDSDAATLLAADGLLTWGLSCPSQWDGISEEARVRIVTLLSGGRSLHQAVAEILFLLAEEEGEAPSQELRKNVLSLAETMDHARIN